MAYRRSKQIINGFNNLVSATSFYEYSFKAIYDKIYVMEEIESLDQANELLLWLSDIVEKEVKTVNHDILADLQQLVETYANDYVGGTQDSIRSSPSAIKKVVDKNNKVEDERDIERKYEEALTTISSLQTELDNTKQELMLMLEDPSANSMSPTEEFDETKHRNADLEPQITQSTSQTLQTVDDDVSELQTALQRIKYLEKELLSSKRDVQQLKQRLEGLTRVGVYGTTNSGELELELAQTRDELNQVKADCSALIEAKISLQSKMMAESEEKVLQLPAADVVKLKEALAQAELDLQKRDFEINHWKSRTKSLEKSAENEVQNVVRAEKAERLRVLQENRILAEKMEVLELKLEEMYIQQELAKEKTARKTRNRGKKKSQSGEKQKPKIENLPGLLSDESDPERGFSELEEKIAAIYSDEDLSDA